MVQKKTGFQRVTEPEIHLSGIRKIVVLGDPGCTGFSEESKRVLGKILEQKADLFFILGDLAFLDSEDELREMIEFCEARVRVPVFTLQGNHELTSYAKFLGSSTYALVLDRHVCFFLCNARGHFSGEDLDLLQKMLVKYSTKNFILFMHVPPPIDFSRKALCQEDWDKLKFVLDPHRERILRLFCAHIHGFHEYLADGYPVTITAGGGAAMIHSLAEPANRIYHSIVLSFLPDGSLNTRRIPV